MPSSKKDILRKQGLSARQSLPISVRANLSNIIQKQLLHQFSSIGSRWLIYRSMPDEVDTKKLFPDSSVPVFAPVVEASGCLQWCRISSDSRWRRGVFGVEEPESGHLWRPEGVDTLIICPLLAFDRGGARLGFGRGFFDRWLNSYSEHIICRVGLAFSCQEIKHIPTEQHDVSLDYIVTEQEVITCNSV